MIRMILRLALCSCVGTMWISFANAKDAKDAKLPAEVDFEKKVNDAKKTYNAALEAARNELKADLKKAMDAATTAGDLDKAIAIRDRLGTAGELGSDDWTAYAGLLGKYDFRYSNDSQREFLFAKDGTLTHLTTNGKTPERKANVYQVHWFREKGEVIGYANFANVPGLLRIVVTPKGVAATSYHPADPPVTAKGKKL